MFNHGFFDGWIILKILFWGIMVATAVDMITFAHMVRECNLRIPVNISGKTGLSAALWAHFFTARSVFLKMESVLTHNAFVFDYCKSKTSFAVCSPCCFAGKHHFQSPKTARLKKLQAATRVIHCSFWLMVHFRLWNIYRIHTPFSRNARLWTFSRACSDTTP